MGEREKGEAASRKQREQELYRIHVQLVRLQRHVIESGRRVLVILEGRDAAGKDGAIKRVTKHMSPRETRVFAPSKPSDRESESWYFQRFVPELPASGEIVIFNRSWYNRAGVELVMGYCSKDDTERFLSQAPVFERLLVDSGIHLVKLYLDIGLETQTRRMQARRKNPLKQWKISPVDERALELWPHYSAARDEMLARTHSEHAPWVIVRADHKKSARLGVMKLLLARIDFPERDEALAAPDPEIVFRCDEPPAGGPALAP